MRWIAPAPEQMEWGHLGVWVGEGGSERCRHRGPSKRKTCLSQVSGLRGLRGHSGLACRGGLLGRETLWKGNLGGPLSPFLIPPRETFIGTTHPALSILSSDIKLQ